MGAKAGCTDGARDVIGFRLGSDRLVVLGCTLNSTLR